VANTFYSYYKRITEAREYLMMDKPWQAEAVLREVQRKLREELCGDLESPPRPRLVSRGLTRGR